jgi:hypothetical protein
MPKDALIKRRSARINMTDKAIIMGIMKDRKIPFDEAVNVAIDEGLERADWSKSSLWKPATKDLEHATVSFYLLPSVWERVESFLNTSGMDLSRCVRGCIRAATKPT